MKHYILLFMIGLAYSTQTDTTNWYPLETGNKWFYSYGIGEIYFDSTEVIGDTLMPNGHTYAVIKRGYGGRYQRNHDNRYVYVYNPTDSTEYVLYDFVAVDSTFWKIPDEPDLFWGIQESSREYNYYLEKETGRKLFDWVTIDSSSGVADTVWNARLEFWPIEITQGIGYSENLFAAIIAGDTLGNLTSIKNKSSGISRFRLYQNYPNPFNPITKIAYSIEHAARVKISVYDISGRKIQTLVDNHQQAGRYTVTFDAGSLSGGIYIYEINAGPFSESRKMLLLK